MAQIDFRRDCFVSTPRAPAEAGMTAAKFQRALRAGLRAPVYQFPRLGESGSTIDRYLRSDLRRLAEGALL